MPRFLDAPQQSPLWYEHRAGHATASRFIDIIGSASTREAYMWELVAERLAGPRRDGGGKAKDWGKTQEAVARPLYKIRTGELVLEVGFAVHDRIKWLGCSSDGLVRGQKKGIEIKCPFNHAIHARTLALGMPEEHKPQTQGNIWILDFELIDFISFDPSFKDPYDLYIETFQRDDKYIKYLESQVKPFLAEVNIAVQDLKSKYH